MFSSMLFLLCFYVQIPKFCISCVTGNPPADKWISSWILDPYNQDRKVLMLDTDIPFNEAKLFKEERRKKGKYLFTDVCPCSIQVDLDLQVLQKVLQYNDNNNKTYFLFYHD
jgi:hypothetical protein